MIERYTIDFIEEKQKVEMPVTKFGGQPVWLSNIVETTKNLLYKLY